MIKRITTSILSIFLIASCGGGGSGSSGNSNNSAQPPNSQPNIPLDNKFYGTWEAYGEAYVTISKDSVTTYAYDHSMSCYEAAIYNVVSSTATSMTTSDVQNGDEETTNFELSGTTLILEENGETLTLEQPYIFNPTPGCDSLYGIRDIEIKLELEYLPPETIINRTALDTGHVEYLYKMFFDLNENGLVDPGDVSIEIKYYKGRDGLPEDHVVSIDEIGGEIWTLRPDNLSDKIFETTSERFENTVDLTQIDNTLSFKFNVEQHPLLAHINENSMVTISTYLKYPEPEVEVKDSWTDGPWNWSSEVHRDAFPDTGFTRIDSHPNMLLIDASADLSEGESMWVDIKTVEFVFN